MAKLKFNPEVSVGHLLVLAGFIIPAITYGFTFASDFKIYKSTVDKQNTEIQELKTVISKQTENLTKINQLLEDHIKYTAKQDLK